MTNFQMKFSENVSSFFLLKLVPIERERPRKYLKSNLQKVTPHLGKLWGFEKGGILLYDINDYLTREKFPLFQNPITSPNGYLLQLTFKIFSGSFSFY